MLHLDLNKPFLDLNGKPMVDEGGIPALMGPSLAMALGASHQEDPLFFYQVATELAQGKPLELNKSQLTLLLFAVHSLDVFTTTAKAQLILEIKAVMDSIE